MESVRHWSLNMFRCQIGQTAIYGSASQPFLLWVLLSALPRTFMHVYNSTCITSEWGYNILWDIFIYMYHLRVPQSTSATSLQGQGQFFFCLFLSYFGWSKEHIHHIREKVLILAFRCSCCIKQAKCMTASLIPATLLSSVHLSTKTVWLIGKMCDLSVSRVPSFPIVPLSSQFWHHWKQRVRLLLKMEWFYATY